MESLPESTKSTNIDAEGNDQIHPISERSSPSHTTSDEAATGSASSKKQSDVGGGDDRDIPYGSVDEDVVAEKESSSSQGKKRALFIKEQSSTMKVGENSFKNEFEETDPIQTKHTTMIPSRKVGKRKDIKMMQSTKIRIEEDLPLLDNESGDAVAPLNDGEEAVLVEEDTDPELNSINNITTFNASNVNISTRRPESRKRRVIMTWKLLFSLFLFLLFFPLFPLLISAVLGGILALVEGEAFQDGFLYVASNLLQLGTPLTDFNPDNPAGSIIDIYVSVVGYLTFGIVLNVINIFQIPLYVNQRIEECVKGERPILVPTIALGVVIPLYVSIIGIIFGSFLAWIEGWNIIDGILYCLSNILGLATALTDVTPETMGGAIVDIIVSSMALGTAAVVVDYVTVLNPARYIRKRLREQLDRWSVIDVDEPGITTLHRLAYASEDEEEAAIIRDEEQRRRRHSPLNSTQQIEDV